MSSGELNETRTERKEILKQDSENNDNVCIAYASSSVTNM